MGGDEGKATLWQAPHIFRNSGRRSRKAEAAAEAESFSCSGVSVLCHDWSCFRSPLGSETAGHESFVKNDERHSSSAVSYGVLVVTRPPVEGGSPLAKSFIADTTRHVLFEPLGDRVDAGPGCFIWGEVLPSLESLGSSAAVAAGSSRLVCVRLNQSFVHVLQETAKGGDLFPRYGKLPDHLPAD